MLPRILKNLKSLGPSKREIARLSWHNPLSQYFVWFAHDKKEHLYQNKDGSEGFVWECTPIPYTTEKALQLSEALTKLPVPSMSVVQVLFHADEYIEPFLESYRDLRKHHPEGSVVRVAVERSCEFLRKCTKGIAQLANIPLRNHRVILSVKWPADEDIDRSEIRLLVEVALQDMGLSPRHMRPGKLLEWLRRLFNDEVPDTVYDGESLAATYDARLPIGDQVIYAENEVYVRPFHKHIQIGGRFWRCMTPKSFPKKQVDPLQTKELFSGIWGNVSNNEQHRVPFLYCLNIIYDDLKTEINLKTDMVMWQNAAGAGQIRALNRRREEQIWASDKINDGERFAHVMAVMWFMAPTDEEAKRAVKRGKQQWERHGYTMQEDRWILTALLLSSLPMGMRASTNNLNILKRTIVADPAAICNILPIQGDFVGLRDAINEKGEFIASRDCKAIYQGRSGQIIPVSTFNSITTNYNGLICGGTGGGKSYGENKSNFAEFATGTMLRIIDIGYSYKKMCQINKGRFIDIAEEIPCMNPFTTISLDNSFDEEGFSKQQQDLSTTRSIMMQMAYSATNEPNISENEYTLIKDAVDWSWETARTDASVDEVFAYLREFPKHQRGHLIDTKSIRDSAHHLAFNLREFTSDGRYPDFFVGKSTFDIKSDPLVVFELETLQNNKDLFNTLTLAVLDAMSRNLYLSDRSKPQLVKFDEAWKVLYGRGQNPMFVDTVGGGFRRARKYHGGFWVVLQSVLDKGKLGAVGDVIWGNSDYKYYLKSPDFEAAHREKLIDVDPFTLAQLKSLDNRQGEYSEMFMETPFGSGVVRIAEDPFSHYLYTSKGTENAEMEKMVEAGMTWTEAINEMVRKYRSH